MSEQDRHRMTIAQAIKDWLDGWDEVNGPGMEMPEEERLLLRALGEIRRLEGFQAELDAIKGKRAPVQGFAGGIPWEMHMRAYDAYCKEHGRQPALIDLEGKNCRGGFGVTELDDFIPGWRDQLPEGWRNVKLPSR